MEASSFLECLAAEYGVAPDSEITTGRMLALVQAIMREVRDADLAAGCRLWEVPDFHDILITTQEDMTLLGVIVVDP